jgi:hypothetical protein
MVATRARWRVDSKSKSSENMGELNVEECESVGDMGNDGGGRTRTGKVVVVEVVEVVDGGWVIPVVRP